jgi:hypothetical protein
MKLQNNKTGEIGVINLKIYGDNAEYNYESLKEFNEDWGEVKYPLIKNEKLKEIFRKWSDCFEKDVYEVNHYNHGKTTLFTCMNNFEVTIELPGCFGEPNECYSLEQIIGE